ncbi:hypothetical protein ACA30_13685 [Virgibacillus soli]|nr:hypothetical protein ACA30_13685 [Virgibacillus soli]
MKKKKNKLLGVLMGVVFFSSFFIPKETKPSPSTRVILENTYKTYIAPVCFEQSNATNWIEETTLQKAKELNYTPHSSCTENALKPEKDRLFTSLLKELGILENKWRNW